MVTSKIVLQMIIFFYDSCG
nr:unnamed protein product [Callosobruchus analis]